MNIQPIGKHYRIQLSEADCHKLWLDENQSRQDSSRTTHLLERATVARNVKFSPGGTLSIEFTISSEEDTPDNVQRIIHVLQQMIGGF